MKKKQKVKLIPPDPKQCQRHHASGCWPDAEHFMIIGPRELTQCKRKPEFIITEVKPGKDGQRGSMSLCGPCMIDAIEQLGPEHFTFTRIAKGKP